MACDRLRLADLFEGFSLASTSGFQPQSKPPAKPAVMIRSCFGVLGKLCPVFARGTADLFFEQVAEMIDIGETEGVGDGGDRLCREAQTLLDQRDPPHIDILHRTANHICRPVFI